MNTKKWTSQCTLLNACQVSESYADVLAVIVEIIALGLTAIFRCTVISKKGLSCAVMSGQMGTH